MRSRFIAGIVLPMCLLSLACSQVQKPTASLRSADVGAITTDGFTANFALDVHNPNSFELPLTNADYALSLLQRALTPKGVIKLNNLRLKETTL